MDDLRDMREIVMIFVDYVRHQREAGIINEEQYEKLTTLKVAYLNSSTCV